MLGVRQDIVPRSVAAEGIQRQSAPERAAGPLTRLKALVLLGGSVRPPVLSARMQRSLLDFPIDSDHTFMQYWQNQAVALATAIGEERLRVRVLLARHSLKPRRPERVRGISLRIERDPVEYRGIGGVLRDLAGDYDHDDYILVASAAQLLLEPLADLANQLASFDINHGPPDVSLVSHHDGTPSGLMLVRCGSLWCIPQIGYVDMKEQALPLIAQRHRVRVVRPPQLSAIPVRTLGDYISALRWRHRGMTLPDLRSMRSDPFAEDWQPSFRIVENGALVDPHARVHDSVVLRGARVERNALLVRSVVGPGGTVPANATICEELVGEA